MKISIGLPSTLPGVQRELIFAWAKRADACPFASLGVIGRLVYPNYEPLITLAAAAGVTQRIRLMTAAVKHTIQSFADIGMDELMFWPCIPDLAQIDRLTDLIS